MLLTTLLADSPTWLADYRHHELLLGRGLALLGTWAILHLLLGGYRLPRSDAREWPHHFYLMNCGWAFVNAVLAAIGILRTHPGRPPLGFTAADALASQALTQQIFLGSIVLDLAYLLVASWLLSRSREPGALRPERLYGYGRAVQLQGAFLLVFDAVMWVLLR